MAPRPLSATALTIHPELLDAPLGSPVRRIVAFLLDALLLLVPSLIVAAGAAALSLRLSDPDAFAAMAALLQRSSPTANEGRDGLGRLAPMLVRTKAEGLPPSVALAVENGDLHAAGEILEGYTFDISLNPGTDAGPVADGHIRIEAGHLVPRGLRSAAAFGVAALYFTLFTSGRRSRTLGKRLLGLRVQRLDARPLSWWESFERFGGYLASLGTFGLGLLDLWRDPNRRLAHDRISNTVVLRATRCDEER